MSCYLVYLVIILLIDQLTTKRVGLVIRSSTISRKKHFTSN